MRALVISNDIIPGFGLPVAAPGIRAAGLAEGLRSHGIDVDVAVPQTILDRVWTRSLPPAAPDGASIVQPTDLASLIDGNGYSDVIYTNANMAPHLQPRSDIRYIYDLFAPKVLELLCSDERSSKQWEELASKKERAFALADHVFVNGHRKLGYALGWLLRPSVQRIRQERFDKPPLITGDPSELVTVAEMAVPLPDGIEVRNPSHLPSGPLKIAMAGYAQSWSGADREALIARLLDAGHELRVLAPRHWGNPHAAAAESLLDSRVHVQQGALGYPEFGAWLQSADVSLDLFDQSAERTLAMITRTTVALRLGVPVIHAVDSETSDIVRDHDAGWVCGSGDIAAVLSACAAASDPERFAAKQRGAIQASTLRFAPHAALATATRLWEQT